MPNEPKIRVDKTEFTKRIFTIQGWIVEGVHSALIIQQILTNQWCTSQRHAERMLKKARDMWTSVEETDIEQKRKLRVVEYQHLARSLSERHKGTPSGIVALMSVHKQIDLLQGLKPAKKVELSTPPGKPLEIKTTKENIDYTKLSDAALEEIVKARVISSE